MECRSLLQTPDRGGLESGVLNQMFLVAGDIQIAEIQKCILDAKCEQFKLFLCDVMHNNIVH